MFLALSAVIAALVFGGFYFWARRQGLLSPEQAAAGGPGGRRISLLTEAVAYIGAVLILAGGIAAVGQRWHNIAPWGRVGILAGAAVFFLLAGGAVRRVREPAIQRLTDVLWLLSVAAAGWAVGSAAYGVYRNTARVTVLAVGAGITVYAAAVWLARRHALENVALFTGLIMTICGAILTIDRSASALPFSILLWGLGLAWAALGWRHYVEPLWVAVPSGAILALIAPSMATAEHGWMYGIGIATAAAALAASVPLRNTPLLALGALAMFSYVTGGVVRYFQQSLGVGGALAISGVLILGLAIVTARLLRAARPPKPGQPGAEVPSRPAPPPDLQEHGADKPAHRDLPRAS